MVLVTLLCNPHDWALMKCASSWRTFLVDLHYVQLWNWFVATNVLSPKPPSQVPPHPRRTFTTITHNWDYVCPSCLAYEDALKGYDELVDWAMTEARALPSVSNGDMEAAIHSHQYMPSSVSTSASGMSSPSNDAQSAHSSTRKKCGRSKGTTRASPQTAQPPNGPTRRMPKTRKTNMPPRTQTCKPPPYKSHRPPPPKSGQEGNPTSQNHSSKKRSSNSESKPRSKKGHTMDHEESHSRRKRSSSSRPSDSTCQEPPTAWLRQQQRPVNHATPSEKEIKKWLNLVTDGNLSRRQRRKHALQFLGAADSTQVTLQYRTVSLQLHLDKIPSDALAKQRWQVFGCARDMLR